MSFSHLVMMCIACQNCQPIHDFPWKWTTRMRSITSVMSMIWMKLNNKDELINTTNVNDMEKNHNLWMPSKKHIMCMILTTYTQVTIRKTLWWHQWNKFHEWKQLLPVCYIWQCGWNSTFWTMVFFTYKSNLINWSISSMLLNFIHVVLLIIYSLAFLCNFIHIVEFIDIILSMWCGSFSINFIQSLVTIKGKNGLRTKSFLRIQFDICGPFYKIIVMMISLDLDGMGYSRRLYKKTIPNYKFIRGWFQTENFKK
jgi:hypothetical protein